jgi:hypothetical protein
MAKVFISYRRADSAAFSGRIYDHLISKFGRKNVFKDVDDIPAGVDFGDYIQTSLRQCAVELVVIGPQWVTSLKPNGERRLDDPADFVRIEVETALNLGLTVIPVLVENASMPGAEDLPESLHRLARINALSVRHDPDFTRDMERVIASLERAFSSRPSPGVFGRRSPSAPASAGASVGSGRIPVSAVTVAPSGPPARAKTKVATQERPARKAIGAAIPFSSPLVAGLATVVVVVAFAALLGPPALRTLSGHGASPTPTATSTLPTVARVTVTLPYHTDLPGQGCDHGNAPWITSFGPGILSACTGTSMRFQSSVGQAISTWRAANTTNFPASVLVSAQVSRIDFPAYGDTVSYADFAVGTIGNVYSFRVSQGGSSQVTVAAFRSDTDGDHSLYTSTRNLSETITVAIAVHGVSITYTLDGTAVTSYTEQSAELPQMVTLGAIGYCQADFSNFNLASVS